MRRGATRRVRVAASLRGGMPQPRVAVCSAGRVLRGRSAVRAHAHSASRSALARALIRPSGVLRIRHSRPPGMEGKGGGGGLGSRRNILERSSRASAAHGSSLAARHQRSERAERYRALRVRPVRDLRRAELDQTRHAGRAIDCRRRGWLVVSPARRTVSHAIVCTSDIVWHSDSVSSLSNSSGCSRNFDHLSQAVSPSHPPPLPER
jgi:hypothetical protein